ncbi:EamA family transporter [Acinetobacter sp. UBA3106]|uniref:EamA family transporter n=1 Tax=Acinetobacter sp. UBA3106 TaxID=1945936 RepID=UPI0025C4BC80|nr:EamA family transporter [Acinetobacter sp. UBA3106]
MDRNCDQQHDFHVLLILFFSLKLWFWLLRKYLANSVGVFSFLVPIFGMISGVIFLHEQIELNFMLGTGLVLIGVVTVSLPGWISKFFSIPKSVSLLKKPSC